MHTFLLPQGSEEASRGEGGLNPGLAALEDALGITDHPSPSQRRRGQVSVLTLEAAAGPQMATSSLLKLMGQPEGCIQWQAEQLAYACILLA